MRVIRYFSPPVAHKSILRVEKECIRDNIGIKDITYRFSLKHNALKTVDSDTTKIKNFLGNYNESYKGSSSKKYFELSWPDFLENQFPNLSGEIGYIRYEVDENKALTELVFPKGRCLATNPFFSLRYLGQYLEYLSMHDLIQNERIEHFINPWRETSYLRKIQLKKADITENNNKTKANEWVCGFARSIATGAKKYDLHIDSVWKKNILNLPHIISIGRIIEKFKIAFAKTYGKLDYYSMPKQKLERLNGAKLLFNESDYLFLFKTKPEYLVGLSDLVPKDFDALFKPQSNSRKFEDIDITHTTNLGKLNATNKIIYFSSSVDTIHNEMRKRSFENYEIFDFYDDNRLITVAVASEE
jgi:hypothetical protein